MAQQNGLGPDTAFDAVIGARSEDRRGGSIDASNTENNPTRQHWRDRLSVHPKAEQYPLLKADELRTLAADIEAHGLRYRVKAYIDPNSNKQILLDGRNRLSALQLLEREIFGRDGALKPEWCEQVLVRADTKPEELEALIDGLNLHRRHLTSEQKRDLAAKLLKLDPKKSDRQIAAAVNVDHKTVAKERRKKEARGEITHVEARTDTKGRRQPAARTIKVKVTCSTIPIVAPFTVVEGGEPPKVVNLAISHGDGGEQRHQENGTTFDHQSRHALAQFKYACKAYLPKMNAAHRQEAVDHVASIVAKIDKAAP